MAYIDLDQLKQLIFTKEKQSIVLIAIDFELKFNTKEVTEIGLSIVNLDSISSTTLATPVSTLAYVNTLADHIESYHLRISRWYRWINKFPSGSRPDGFDPQFGHSEKIPAARVVARMKQIMWDSGQEKMYILVGCALAHERETLNDLGFDFSRVKYNIDIQVEDRSIRRRCRDGSLLKICGKLGLSAVNLHNAGNDARYTMECLLRLLTMSSLHREEYSWSPTSSISWTESIVTPSTSSESSTPLEESTTDFSSITSNFDNINIANVNTGNVTITGDKAVVTSTCHTTDTMNLTKTTNVIGTTSVANGVKMTSLPVTANTDATTPATDVAKMTSLPVTANAKDTSRAADTKDTKQRKKMNQQQRQRAKKQAEAARKEKIQSLFAA